MSILMSLLGSSYISAVWNSLEILFTVIWYLYQGFGITICHNAVVEVTNGILPVKYFCSNKSSLLCKSISWR